MFFSDLIKHINIDVEVDFIRMKSYEGTSSSGTVKTFDFGILNIPQGSNILIVEDIIDTGTTLIELNKTFQKTNPKSLKVASLLFKKEAYKAYLPIDYYAFEIPNNFVVGYGLDFDELGRNLPEIYKLKNA
jgi:hypoxanthine phosphoribosyltransferase